MNYLALIRTGSPEAIVSVFPATTGRIDLPDVGQLSPPQAGWEGDGYRIAEIGPSEIPAGKQVVSFSVEGCKLLAGIPTWRLEDQPAQERRRVEKWVIIERVNGAGKAAAAKALLDMPGNEAALFKWNAPVQSVYFDDADTVGMVVALGLDPAVIMAPE